ncbi:MAG: hypothetical protein WCC64_20965 [Aliidongia sp.]
MGAKSRAKLAAAPCQMGHKVGASSIRKLLLELGQSRQAKRKANDGSHHIDRDAQFEHINARILACQAAGQPGGYQRAVQWHKARSANGR